MNKLYSFLKIPLGFWTLLLAHTTLGVPFVAVTVYSRAAILDANIFDDLDKNDKDPTQSDRLSLRQMDKGGRKIAGIIIG